MEQVASLAAALGIMHCLPIQIGIISIPSRAHSQIAKNKRRRYANKHDTQAQSRASMKTFPLGIDEIPPSLVVCPYLVTTQRDGRNVATINDEHTSSCVLNTTQRSLSESVDGPSLCSCHRVGSSVFNCQNTIELRAEPKRRQRAGFYQLCVIAILIR